MLDETIRIKMPMPKCCEECLLKTTYDYYENSSSYIEGEDPHYVYRCEVTGERVYTDITQEEGMKRHKDCPIVVEKPYKVKNIKNVSGWIIGKCPSCGSNLNKAFSQNFCGNCGNALDWEGSEQKV